MKKLLVSLALLSSSLFAEYKMFVNKTKPLGSSIMQTKKVIFFRELSDYQSSLKKINKNIVANDIAGTATGLSGQVANLANAFFKEGLKVGVSGAKIGMIYSLLDAPIMSLYANQMYIKVYKETSTNGKVVLENKFFIGDKNPKLS